VLLTEPVVPVVLVEVGVPVLPVLDDVEVDVDDVDVDVVDVLDVEVDEELVVEALVVEVVFVLALVLELDELEVVLVLPLAPVEPVEPVEPLLVVDECVPLEFELAEVEELLALFEPLHPNANNATSVALQVRAFEFIRDDMVTLR
jgi:hypothetical protein